MKENHKNRCKTKQNLSNIFQFCQIHNAAPFYLPDNIFVQFYINLADLKLLYCNTKLYCKVCNCAVDLQHNCLYIKRIRYFLAYRNIQIMFLVLRAILSSVRYRCHKLTLSVNAFLGIIYLSAS